MLALQPCCTSEQLSSAPRRAQYRPSSSTTPRLECLYARADEASWSTSGIGRASEGGPTQQGTRGGYAQVGAALEHAERVRRWRTRSCSTRLLRTRSSSRHCAHDLRPRRTRLQVLYEAGRRVTSFLEHRMPVAVLARPLSVSDRFCPRRARSCPCASLRGRPRPLGRDKGAHAPSPTVGSGPSHPLLCCAPSFSQLAQLPSSALKRPRSTGSPVSSLFPSSVAAGSASSRCVPPLSLQPFAREG